MITLTVIKSRVRQNKITGKVQSIYGSCPPDPDNWEVVDRGFTWEMTDNNGVTTVGLGRKSAKTIVEANATAVAFQNAIPNVVVNLMESV